jgi:molybdenum cofactor cytidylyltransferase
MTDQSPPVISPPEPIENPSSDVWGVVLAAGTSTRFGDENKLLEPVSGQPIVRRAAETLTEAALAGVVVVLGHEAGAVHAAVEGLATDVTENGAYETGQSTSVRRGVEYATRRGADAVLVALGDMPYVSLNTVESLLAAHEANVGTAIAAAHGGKRGNPVLFDSCYFDSLTTLTGDIGGRKIFRESPGAVFVETGDHGVHRDIDTPEEIR